MKQVSNSITKKLGVLSFAAFAAVFMMMPSPAVAQVEVTCPADVTVTADAGACSAVVEFPDPEVTGTNASDVITITPPSGSEFPVGTNEVAVVVLEESNVVASCSFNVVVLEAEPPVILDATVDGQVLWPPNHKMIAVTVDYQLADNCDTNPVATLAVTSNEAEDARGSGHTKPDWKIIDDHHVLLRAERSGKGDGRIYTITITATNQSGKESTQDLIVVVPHSRSQMKDLTGKGKGKSHGKIRAYWL